MFSPELLLLASCAVLFAVQPGDGSEIVGGKEVKPHSLPYMALLQSATSMCGGTLIHPKWVLTAAHCGKITTVLLGVHSIRKKKSCQQLAVIQAVPHPAYKKDKKGNDIMLLKLKKAAEQDKTVKWLPLDRPGKEPKAGSSCLVAGWGQTNKEQNKPSDVLMSANVTVVDRKKCSKVYRPKVVITKGMMCAGSVGTDTCQGDSGGPILCKGALVGVTSFGHKCGTAPGVYAYITKEHYSWIKKTIETSEMEE